MNALYDQILLRFIIYYLQYFVIIRINCFASAYMHLLIYTCLLASYFSVTSVLCVCVCTSVLFLQGVHLRDSVYVAEAILSLKVNDLIVNHVTSSSSSSMTPLSPFFHLPPASTESVIYTVAVHIYSMNLCFFWPGCPGLACVRVEY